MTLTKTNEIIQVDKNGKLEQQHIYEKKVVVKIRVNKEVLTKRKIELEEELAQINFDLSQIIDDEKNDI